MDIFTIWICTRGFTVVAIEQTFTKVDLFAEFQNSTTRLEMNN